MNPAIFYFFGDQFDNILFVEYFTICEQEYLFGVTFLNLWFKDILQWSVDLSSSQICLHLFYHFDRFVDIFCIVFDTAVEYFFKRWPKAHYIEIAVLWQAL